MRRDDARLGARICVNQQALLQVVVLGGCGGGCSGSDCFRCSFYSVSTFGLACFWFVWLATVVCLCFYMLLGIFVVKFIVGNEIYLCLQKKCQREKIE